MYLPLQLSEECVCMDEQLRSHAFEIAEVWRESVSGIVSRIELYRCRKCESYWLRYSTEHENSGAWDKWFRGPIGAEQAKGILTESTAERAAEIFRKMPWHFYGGAFYRTHGERSFGPVHVGFGAGLAAAA